MSSKKKSCVCPLFTTDGVEIVVGQKLFIQSKPKGTSYEEKKFGTRTLEKGEVKAICGREAMFLSPSRGMMRFTADTYQLFLYDDQAKAKKALDLENKKAKAELAHRIKRTEDELKQLKAYAKL